MQQHFILIGCPWNSLYFHINVRFLLLIWFNWASNGRMVDKWWKDLGGSDRGLIEVIPRRDWWKPRKTSEYPESRPRFEPSTSRLRVYSVTATLTRSERSLYSYIDRWSNGTCASSALDFLKMSTLIYQFVRNLWFDLISKHTAGDPCYQFVVARSNLYNTRCSLSRV
jgi:hypothetical protein